jgi:hypothetical protein
MDEVITRYHDLEEAGKSTGEVLDDLKTTTKELA